ncbi:MAG: deoxyribose-phosphate aldolase, partial [Erysipelotrichaceae bacterium]|nr:deoxyribose-phosphate aldolase [Erysipelotrichaceae bacterium]
MTEKELCKLFDHTNLKPFLTKADFEKLCNEAKELGTAMVAINSSPVTMCKELLAGTDV